MSDDFIPLNQSTPTGGRWQNQGRNQNFGQQNRFSNQNRFSPRTPRRGGYNHSHNRWGNSSQRNSSVGSDSNSSYGQEKSNIDAYLHPSMLQDPWAELRRRRDESK